MIYIYIYIYIYMWDYWPPPKCARPPSRTV